MTDTPDTHDLPDDPDDELVSAYLDGEATADEVARIESDPALLARVEEFRRVAELVGAPPPVDPAERDAAVAAALAASATATNVTSLATRRAPWFARPAVLVSSAAAVVMVLFLLASAALLAGGDDDDDSGDLATAAVEADDAGATQSATDGGTDGGTDGEAADDSGDDAASAGTATADDSGGAAAAAEVADAIVGDEPAADGTTMADEVPSDDGAAGDDAAGDDGGDGAEGGAEDGGLALRAQISVVDVGPLESVAALRAVAAGLPLPAPDADGQENLVEDVIPPACAAALDELDEIAPPDNGLELVVTAVIDGMDHVAAVAGGEVIAILRAQGDTCITVP